MSNPVAGRPSSSSGMREERRSFATPRTHGSGSGTVSGGSAIHAKEQTLDGKEYERLIVGKAGVTRARMQVKVTKPSNITYEVRGGGVAVDFPKRRF